MNEMTKTIKIVENPVKVNFSVKTKKPVFIERKMTSQGIADDMTSRITGKLIGFGDLYDPKTQQFLSENELKAKGAVIVTISLNKVLGKTDTTTKSRITKNPTPFIRKTTKYQVIANINWASYINKRGHGNFIPTEKRANGVENYCECKGTGKTQAGNFTINGVIFRFLEKTKYFDKNNQEYTDVELLTAEYLRVSSKASKQREADKHGIKLEFDPKYRTTRIDNCDFIRGFGFEYKPTDNTK